MVYLGGTRGWDLELITKSEFARRIGISRQAIDKAIKKDRLRTVGEGRSAKIDIHDHLSVKYMNDNSSNRQVAKQKKSPAETSEKIEEKDPVSDDFGESSKLRDEKLKIQTRKLRMEMAEKMGELVLRSKVEEVFGTVSSSIIAYMFPIGDRLSPALAGVFESTDQDKINETKKIIDKEVGRALDAVKKDIANSLLEIN